MGKWQFHTPDGVIDIGPETCAAKRRLEGRLRELFSLNGYQEVETPAIEFYDVFEAGNGDKAQEGLFKFFDEKGRILCLRYDGTVPVARLAATVNREEQPPLRYGYVGKMYRYNEFGGGRQREFTQAGVELLGSRTPEADAEVIATAIAAALACDIRDFQVSLGQVDFFKGFLAEWKISGEEAEMLPHLIDGKETVALEELSDRLELPETGRRVLLKMASGFGTYDLLDDMSALVSNPQAVAALKNLRNVLDILADYGYLQYVSIDLGLLQSLEYYTGIIFKGFTYGIGFPLFSGGRYDSLVSSFGRDLSATGFSIGVDFLLTALRRQGQLIEQRSETVLIGYEAAARSAAFKLADELRAQGQKAVCDCENKTREAMAELAQTLSAEKVAWLDENKRLEWL